MKVKVKIQNERNKHQWVGLVKQFFKVHYPDDFKDILLKTLNGMYKESRLYSESVN